VRSEFSEAFDPGNHLLLITKQVLKGSPSKDVVNCCLRCAPEHPKGTINRADTVLHLAGMLLTEITLEQTTAEYSHHVAEDDLAGRARQRIAAGTARRRDESAYAQYPQELADVGLRDAFGIADLRDGQSAAWSFLPEADQAAQAVFFVGREFHR
jgi:hypothetical protein